MLEDHAHLVAADVPQLLLVHREQVLAVYEDLAASRFDETAKTADKCRLTAAERPIMTKVSPSRTWKETSLTASTQPVWAKTSSLERAASTESARSRAPSPNTFQRFRHTSVKPASTLDRLADSDAFAEPDPPGMLLIFLPPATLV